MENTTVNATQNALISDFLALRKKAWAYDRDVAAQFSRDGARGWKESGFDGLRGALWIFAAEVRGTSTQLASEAETLIQKILLTA
jgi:hypothetical protein